jgi:arsenical pump membrane protein
VATILWLAALRRDGFNADAWSFLKLGLPVTPPALIVALAAVVASN